MDNNTFSFTFDSHIRSLEQFQIGKSRITIIGEEHAENVPSNMSQYIREMTKSNPNTLVFLELDTALIDDEIYMTGISSSTIKDIRANFNNDSIVSFDNRNYYLGGGNEHYELYRLDPRNINDEKMRHYIDTYKLHYNNMSWYIKDRHREIPKILDSYEKKLLEVRRLNKTLKEYMLSDNYYDRSNASEVENQLEFVKQQTMDLHINLIERFRELWANIIDEGLFIMMIERIRVQPETEYDFVVIVGERHARHILDNMIHYHPEFRGVVRRTSPTDWIINNRRNNNRQELLTTSWWNIPRWDLPDVPEDVYMDLRDTPHYEHVINPI